MSRNLILAAGAALVVCIGGSALTLAQNAAQPGGASLRPASSFASIANQRDRSVALFAEMGKVLTSPRCMNCHPATERPRQGDLRKLHEPLVVRGKDGHGAAGLHCATCHGKQNFDPAGVPGDGHWALAPASMAWEGKTVGQICEQLKDQNRNGSRAGEARHHRHARALGLESRQGAHARAGHGSRVRRADAGLGR